jgi:hypothetical protein
MQYEFRKRKNSQKKPSTSYYLGYVDDFESVEDIEKKFQELEKLKGSGNETLNEKEQEELYSKTSNLYVQEEVHLQLNPSPSSIPLEGEDYFSDFFNSESDYEQTMEEEEEFFENKKRKRFSFKKQHSGSGGGGEIHHHLGKFILQKLSTPWKDDTCEIIKIPEDPIPIPWCKTIIPLLESEEKENGKIHVKKKIKEEGILVESISKFNFQSLPSFDAILIHSNYKTIHQLKQLPLDKNYLIKRGYIFIWIEKENISEMMNYFEKINFIYVENMVWVKKELNNQYSKEDYFFTKKSKRTLFIFKKNNEETKKLDIRHQRNPDTVFDFKEPMEFVYSIVETLLFTSKQNNIPFLELYSSFPFQKRENWISIREE